MAMKVGDKVYMKNEMCYVREDLPIFQQLFKVISELGDMLSQDIISKVLDETHKQLDAILDRTNIDITFTVEGARADLISKKIHRMIFQRLLIHNSDGRTAQEFNNVKFLAYKPQAPAGYVISERLSSFLYLLRPKIPGLDKIPRGRKRSAAAKRANAGDNRGAPEDLNDMEYNPKLFTAAIEHRSFRSVQESGGPKPLYGLPMPLNEKLKRADGREEIHRIYQNHSNLPIIERIKQKYRCGPKSFPRRVIGPIKKIQRDKRSRLLSSSRVGRRQYIVNLMPDMRDVAEMASEFGGSLRLSAHNINVVDDLLPGFPKSFGSGKMRSFKLSKSAIRVNSKERKTELIQRERDEEMQAKDQISGEKSSEGARGELQGGNLKANSGADLQELNPSGSESQGSKAPKKDEILELLAYLESDLHPDDQGHPPKAAFTNTGALDLNFIDLFNEGITQDLSKELDVADLCSIVMDANNAENLENIDQQADMLFDLLTVPTTQALTNIPVDHDVNVNDPVNQNEILNIRSLSAELEDNATLTDPSMRSENNKDDFSSRLSLPSVSVKDSLLTGPLIATTDEERNDVLTAQSVVPELLGKSVASEVRNVTDAPSSISDEDEHGSLTAYKLSDTELAKKKEGDLLAEFHRSPDNFLAEPPIPDDEICTDSAQTKTDPKIVFDDTIDDLTAYLSLFGEPPQDYHFKSPSPKIGRKLSTGLTLSPKQSKNDIGLAHLLPCTQKENNSGSTSTSCSAELINLQNTCVPTKTTESKNDLQTKRDDGSTNQTRQTDGQHEACPDINQGYKRSGSAVSKDIAPVYHSKSNINRNDVVEGAVLTNLSSNKSSAECESDQSRYLVHKEVDKACSRSSSVNCELVEPEVCKPIEPSGQNAEEVSGEKSLVDILKPIINFINPEPEKVSDRDAPQLDDGEVIINDFRGSEHQDQATSCQEESGNSTIKMIKTRNLAQESKSQVLVENNSSHHLLQNKPKAVKILAADCTNANDHAEQRAARVESGDGENSESTVAMFGSSFPANLLRSDAGEVVGSGVNDVLSVPLNHEATIQAVDFYSFHSKELPVMQAIGVSNSHTEEVQTETDCLTDKLSTHHYLTHTNFKRDVSSQCQEVIKSDLYHNITTMVHSVLDPNAITESACASDNANETIPIDSVVSNGNDAFRVLDIGLMMQAINTSCLGDDSAKNEPLTFPAVTHSSDFATSTPPIDQNVAFHSAPGAESSRQMSECIDDGRMPFTVECSTVSMVSDTNSSSYGMPQIYAELNPVGKYFKSTAVADHGSCAPASEQELFKEIENSSINYASYATPAESTDVSGMSFEPSRLESSNNIVLCHALCGQGSLAVSGNKKMILQRHPGIMQHEPKSVRKNILPSSGSTASYSSVSSQNKSVNTSSAAPKNVMKKIPPPGTSQRKMHVSGIQKRQRSMMSRQRGPHLGKMVGLTNSNVTETITVKEMLRPAWYQPRFVNAMVNEARQAFAESYNAMVARNISVNLNRRQHNDMRPPGRRQKINQASIRGRKTNNQIPKIESRPTLRQVPPKGPQGQIKASYRDKSLSASYEQSQALPGDSVQNQDTQLVLSQVVETTGNGSREETSSHSDKSARIQVRSVAQLVPKESLLPEVETKRLPHSLNASELSHEALCQQSAQEPIQLTNQLSTQAHISRSVSQQTTDPFLTTGSARLIWSTRPARIESTVTSTQTDGSCEQLERRLLMRRVPSSPRPLADYENATEGHNSSDNKKKFQREKGISDHESGQGAPLDMIPLESINVELDLSGPEDIGDGQNMPYLETWIDKESFEIHKMDEARSELIHQAMDEVISRQKQIDPICFEQAEKCPDSITRSSSDATVSVNDKQDDKSNVPVISGTVIERDYNATKDFNSDSLKVIRSCDDTPMADIKPETSAFLQSSKDDTVKKRQSVDDPMEAKTVNMHRSRIVEEGKEDNTVMFLKTQLVNLLSPAKDGIESHITEQIELAGREDHLEGSRTENSTQTFRSGKIREHSSLSCHGKGQIDQFKFDADDEEVVDDASSLELTHYVDDAPLNTRLKSKENIETPTHPSPHAIISQLVDEEILTKICISQPRAVSMQSVHEQDSERNTLENTMGTHVMTSSEPKNELNSDSSNHLKRENQDPVFIDAVSNHTDEDFSVDLDCTAKELSQENQSNVLSEQVRVPNPHTTISELITEEIIAKITTSAPRYLPTGNFQNDDPEQCVAEENTAGILWMTPSEHRTKTSSIVLDSVVESSDDIVFIDASSNQTDGDFTVAINLAAREMSQENQSCVLSEPVSAPSSNNIILQLITEEIIAKLTTAQPKSVCTDNFQDDDPDQKESKENFKIISAMTFAEQKNQMNLNASTGTDEDNGDLAFVDALSCQTDDEFRIKIYDTDKEMAQEDHCSALSEHTKVPSPHAFVSGLITDEIFANISSKPEKIKANENTNRILEMALSEQIDEISSIVPTEVQVQGGNDNLVIVNALADQTDNECPVDFTSTAKVLSQENHSNGIREQKNKVPSPHTITSATTSQLTMNGSEQNWLGSSQTGLTLETCGREETKVLSKQEIRDKRHDSGVDSNENPIFDRYLFIGNLQKGDTVTDMVAENAKGGSEMLSPEPSRERNSTALHDADKVCDNVCGEEFSKQASENNRTAKGMSHANLVGIFSEQANVTSPFTSISELITNEVPVKIITSQTNDAESSSDSIMVEEILTVRPSEESDPEAIAHNRDLDSPEFCRILANAFEVIHGDTFIGTDDAEQILKENRWKASPPELFAAEVLHEMETEEDHSCHDKGNWHEQPTERTPDLQRTVKADLDNFDLSHHELGGLEEILDAKSSNNLSSDHHKNECDHETEEVDQIEKVNLKSSESGSIAKVSKQVQLTSKSSGHSDDLLTSKVDDRFLEDAESLICVDEALSSTAKDLFAPSFPLANITDELLISSQEGRTEASNSIKSTSSQDLGDKYFASSHYIEKDKDITKCPEEKMEAIGLNTFTELSPKRTLSSGNESIALTPERLDKEALGHFAVTVDISDNNPNLTICGENVKNLTERMVKYCPSSENNSELTPEKAHPDTSNVDCDFESLSTEIRVKNSDCRSAQGSTSLRSFSPRSEPSSTRMSQRVRSKLSLSKVIQRGVRSVSAGSAVTFKGIIKGHETNCKQVDQIEQMTPRITRNSERKGSTSSQPHPESRHLRSRSIDEIELDTPRMISRLSKRRILKVSFPSESSDSTRMIKDLPSLRSKSKSFSK